MHNHETECTETTSNLAAQLSNLQVEDCFRPLDNYEMIDVWVNSFISGDLEPDKRETFFSIINKLSPAEKKQAKALAGVSLDIRANRSEIINSLKTSERDLIIYLLVQLMCRIIELSD